MYKKQGKRKGFSLVELVVTVSILGVLAMVVIPKLNGAVAKSKDTKATASIENLRKASNIYYTEHGKSFSDTYEKAKKENDLKNPEDYQLFKEDLENLVKKGYVEAKAISELINGKNGDASAIEVGSAVTKEQCGAFKSEYIPLKLSEDGIGIIFNVTDKYNSKCELWIDK